MIITKQPVAIFGSIRSEDNMKGRKLTIDQCKSSLSSKGVVFQGNDVNISKAKKLGNKSCGMIDFLVSKENKNGFFLVGMEKYGRI